MSLAVVTLKKGEGRLLKSGGMWIFDNEIATIMGSFVNGDIVLIHDFDGYPLGKGFINTNSKITVRLLTRDENQKIDEEFLEKRVRDAWEYRKKVTDTSSCRLIFGEADFLPALVGQHPRSHYRYIRVRLPACCRFPLYSPVQCHRRAGLG